MIKTLNVNNSLTGNPLFGITAGVVFGLCLNFAPFLLAALMGGIVAWYFWKNQEKFLLFLLIFLPFEELFLKYIPESLYAPARYYWEFCLLIFMVGLIARRLKSNASHKLNIIDGLILAFLVAWFISTVVNSISPIESLQVLKNYVRYIPVFYLAYYCRKREYVLKWSIRILLIMGAIQATICIGQAFEGNILTEIFRPRDVVVGSKLIRGEDIQTGTYYTRFTGSFARSNDLGNYLSYILCLLIAVTPGRFDRSRYITLGVLILAALILSSSRISWLAAYTGVGAILLMMRSKWRLTYFIIPIIAVVILAIMLPNVTSENISGDFNIVSRFVYMFSSDYIETMRDFGRLYAILYVAPSVLSASPILGLGPGTFMPISADIPWENIFKKAEPLGLDPSAARYVHDVGYVAILTQVGLLGLGIIIILFWKIGLAINEKLRYIIQPDAKAFMIAAIGILVAMAVQNLASSNLMYRNQSMIIWLFSGIAVGYPRKSK